MLSRQWGWPDVLSRQTEELQSKMHGSQGQEESPTKLGKHALGSARLQREDIDLALFSSRSVPISCGR